VTSIRSSSAIVQFCSFKLPHTRLGGGAKTFSSMIEAKHCRTVMFETYSTFIFAVFFLVATESYMGPTQPQFRALDLDITSRGDIARQGIKLTTGVYRFSTQGITSSAQVDLFSMVHIADPSYFEIIKDRMKGYDVVLYELITDNKNCDTIKGSDFKRQLNTEISATETEKLASQYDLESQVSLYNFISRNRDVVTRNNWFIADLDANEVGVLSLILLKCITLPSLIHLYFPH
jgi:hypothetical protein